MACERAPPGVELSSVAPDGPGWLEYSNSRTRARCGTSMSLAARRVGLATAFVAASDFLTFLGKSFDASTALWAAQT